MCKTKQKTRKIIEKPYKQESFNAFIRTLKSKNPIVLGSWSNLARVLGVDRKTINNWKQLPKVKKLMTRCIVQTLEKMLEVGKNDWKMFRDVLKMNGLRFEPEKEEKKEQVVNVRFITSPGILPEGKTLSDYI